MTRIKNIPLDNFTEETGCYFKCEKFKEITSKSISSTINFTYVLIDTLLFQYSMTEDESTDNVDWKKDWIAEVYIQAGSNAEDIKREYYTYEAEREIITQERQGEKRGNGGVE